ncbi:MAG: hypothetical protein C4581_05430 [Nitrospiraceae bacterium]|nr:MAG: hypothetical protein C4581_05430 [Nitrospiraceae bacterium]
MKVRNIINYYIWLLLFVLAVKVPAEAQSLSAVFEEGRVNLIGSASFECVPDNTDWASMASVTRLSSPFSDKVFSGGTSVYINTYDEYIDCARPGSVFNYSGNFAGGSLRGDPSPVCILGGSPSAHASVTVPAWPEIEVHHPQDNVSGPTDIIFSYEYFEHYKESKRIMVYIDKEKIYEAHNIPVKGLIETTYDFSGKNGFTLLRFSEVCGSQIVSFSKLVYTKPEDSCEDKVGKPVSVSSGTVYTSETDFSIKGQIPLTFTRYYDSAETTLRDFGASWSHEYDTRVASFGINTYKIINPDGSNVYYIDNNNDKIYDAEFPKGEQSRLVENTNGTFTRESFDGSKEEFNQWGYLTDVEDKNGNMTMIVRNSSNKITSITGPYGRKISVFYNTGNKISSITVPDGTSGGRAYYYTYLPTGHLGKVTYPDASEKSYEYVYVSGIGYRLSGIKDERGNYIERHTYDAKGRAVTSSSDGTNELLTLNYLDETHTAVTDSLGNVTTYTIDKTLGKSHSTEVSGPGCRECGQSDITRIYDNGLNVTSLTDANGNLTQMTYDTNGNMLTKTEAVGTPYERRTTYTYDDFGQILTVMDTGGNITEYIYDDNGNLTDEIDAYGNVTSHTYGPFNEKLSTTDRNGKTTTYTYDLHGNLAAIINALGQTSSYTYDIMGNMLSMTDINGNTTTYEYDVRDRLIKETRPDGGEIIYEYDYAGNRTAVTDVSGGRTGFTYNARNLLISTISPDGSSVNYTYDTENNMTMMITRDSSYNIITSETYLYDDHNRLTRTTYADGTYTDQDYDAIGNVIARRDENGNITTNSYDALNRLTSVTDAEGGITSYSYDSRNNLMSVTDTNGNTTYYTYDNLNRLTSTSSPDTGTTTYTYDANGNMLTKTDAMGISTSYSYDALNRQTVILFPDPSQDINLFYDDTLVENSMGKLTAITDPSGTTWFEYDKMGRLTMETRHIDGLNYSTGYAYDLNGNVTTITYPGGRKINYIYNEMNKATSVSETYFGETRTLANNITYSPYGDIAFFTLGNDITTSKTYDSRNRLNSLTIGTLKQLYYTRDNTGNITGISDAVFPANNKTYSYDYLSRMIMVNGPWGTITYAYDPAGNRTYETSNSGNTIYRYAANTNRLVSAEGEKTFTFNYDDNGNTISESGGSSPTLQQTYVYNHNQRLTRVTNPDTILGEYVYNANGQRVKKYTDNGAWCRIFHYDKNGLLIAESSSSGTIKAEYIFINGQPMAKIEGDNIYYYHNDHLGTPVMMTDSSGQVVWQGEFLPFGEELSISGSVTNNLRFPGQYYDEETGLKQNWFRDYKADVGRYVTFDPLLSSGSQSALSTCQQTTLPINLTIPLKSNPFAYVEGNPINFVDPRGLKCGSGWTDKIVPDSYGTFDFSISCQIHDDCYDKCGTSKLTCDFNFYNNMLQECRKLTWNPISQFSCLETAAIYYGAVSSPLGWYAYNKAQKARCCK